MQRKKWIGILVFAVVIINVAFISADKATYPVAVWSGHSVWADSLLATGDNGLFIGSGDCVICHGYDTAQIASVDLLGNDINVVDDWRSTMMANSARDPFWRAKVSHENHVNPQLQEETETTCTKCHAPMGHFGAIHNGAAHYSIDEMKEDPLAMDGVSCLACHQQGIEKFGITHSGDLQFDTARVAYGPYFSPLESPMVMETGYKPVHSPHVKDAGFCATCHTLVTNVVDLEGNLTDETFVEQATYHEWQNSIYSDFDNTTSCQECHMPAIGKGQVNIVAGYETEPRAPFYLHDLVGANVFMLNILRDNIEALQIPATIENFDETISKTYDLLQNKSLNLNVEVVNRTVDSLAIDVTILNKAGHKFPSGYPSRRAFVQVLVKNAAEDTLFASGLWDDTYEVIGHDDDFEQHHQVITAEDQVQIYEMVVNDIEGNRTTVLERMATPIKDNRLPPIGFTQEHEVYDTVFVAGNALNDLDFNRDGEGAEGSGHDIVHYRIPMQGNGEEVIVEVGVYYQTAPPKWMEEMFAVSTPEIDLFKTMFDQADKTPIPVKTDFVEVQGVVPATDITVQPEWIELEIFDTEVNINAKSQHKLNVYNIAGQLIQTVEQRNNYTVYLPQTKGVYILNFVGANNQQYTRKVIVK